MLLVALRQLQDSYGIGHPTLREHWSHTFPRRWLELRPTGLLPDRLWEQTNELITADRRLHTSWAHGDLVGSNVLAHGDRLTLVDWEFSAERTVMHDPAKLHLFSANHAEVLTQILHILDRPVLPGCYPPAEELALAHAQLLSHYPRRRAALAGSSRSRAYLRQTQRQVDRLTEALARA